MSCDIDEVTERLENELIDRSRPYASTKFHLLPSLLHDPTYNTLTLQKQLHIVTLTSLLSAHKYRYTSPHNEVCSRGANHTNAIYLHSAEPEACNSAVDWH